jgi:diketogulonate reductase-like aldo/keto reductase
MPTDLAASPTLSVQGVTVPAFVYGTAWKEEQTEALTTLALAAGFRAIDTACQRKHYHEAGVGAALAPFLASHGRDAVFLQTKYTYPRGQDHRLPYDPAAPPPEQVHQSFARSLVNLGVERLDSYVLHGPEAREGLSTNDRAVWRAMEELHAAGRVGLLGVSNISADQLRLLLEHARVRPAFVQNRCYASQGWGREVRAICDAHGMVYQGFSLLTANREVWNDKRVFAIARRTGATPAQVLFRYALAMGILPLTGTSDARHMELDLRSRDLVLTEADIATIAALGT